MVPHQFNSSFLLLPWLTSSGGPGPLAGPVGLAGLAPDGAPRHLPGGEGQLRRQAGGQCLGPGRLRQAGDGGGGAGLVIFKFFFAATAARSFATAGAVAAAVTAAAAAAT